MRGDFKAGIEAAWRRYLRAAVRQSGLTLGQKAVTVKVLDLWLHHRNGPKGYIHPGRAKIAKAAKVTEKTVSRTFKELRDFGVLRPVARLRGEGQKPTEYRMSTIALLELCCAEVPDWVAGELVEVAGQLGRKCPTKCPTTGGTKCPTDKRNVRPVPCQGSEMKQGACHA